MPETKAKLQNLAIRVGADQSRRYQASPTSCKTCSIRKCKTIWIDRKMSCTVQATMTTSNLMITFTKTPSSSYKKTLFAMCRLPALWITHYSTHQVSRMVTVIKLGQADFNHQCINLKNNSSCSTDLSHSWKVPAISEHSNKHHLVSSNQSMQT